MRRREPFNEVRERMEDVFNSFRDLDRLSATGFSAFPVDVEESNGEVVVRADIPGVEREQIEVHTSQNGLEIRASHEEDVEEEQKNYYRRERRSRRFQRTVSLPAPVDPDSASAEYENGVLTVKMEKAEGDGRRQVEVN